MWEFDDVFKRTGGEGGNIHRVFLIVIFFISFLFLSVSICVHLWLFFFNYSLDTRY